MAAGKDCSSILDAVQSREEQDWPIAMNEVVIREALEC